MNGAINQNQIDREQKKWAVLPSTENQKKMSIRKTGNNFRLT